MQPGNPDIRGEVESSRGLLKKIQLHLPLFRGYRKLEDLRAADELLRKQISDILQQALQALQNERVTLVDKGDFGKLTNIASGISGVQEFQGEILHAQQGYSGISPTIRMDQGKLNDLYEYDLKFLDASANVRDLSVFNASEDLSDSLQKLSNAVNLARTAWESRISAVQNILLTPGGNQ